MRGFSFRKILKQVLFTKLHIFYKGQPVGLNMLDIFFDTYF